MKTKAIIVCFLLSIVVLLPQGAFSQEDPIGEETRKKVVATLIDVILHDESEMVRSIAIDTLYAWGPRDHDVAATFAKVVEDEPSIGLRRAALGYLVKMGPLAKNYLPVLEKVAGGECSTGWRRKETRGFCLAVQDAIDQIERDAKIN